MLVVHWSPVRNTRAILRRGLTAGKHSAIHFFPLTGHSSVDRWWGRALRAWRPRTQYNGFVVRLTDDDLPATFGHWLHWTDDAGEHVPRYHSVDELNAAIRETFLWRIGESVLDDNSADNAELGHRVIENDPGVYHRLRSDPAWMRYVLEDHEIKVFQSFPASRILRTISGSASSGRQRRRRFRNGD